MRILLLENGGELLLETGGFFLLEFTDAFVFPGAVCTERLGLACTVEHVGMTISVERAGFAGVTVERRG